MTSQTRNIKRWIERLNDSSNNDPGVLDALMNLRPLSKQDSGIKDIDNQGGIEALLNLIQRPNKRLLDVSISILANCLTKKCVRKKVVKCEGIPKIVKVLQTIKSNTILTRTCRALANLADNPDASKTIYAIGAVELIIKLVKQTSETDSPYCIASALRALRNLASTPAYRKKLIQYGVVGAGAIRLDSEITVIVSESIRLIAAVSKSCTLEFADHMLAYDAMPIRRVVKIMDLELEEDSDAKAAALTTLINLTLQGCARPAIGNAGGLSIFVHELEDIIFSDDYDAGEELPERSFQLVGAICYCCREAINRAKLREMDTLSDFVRILTDERWNSIHTFILATLLCFVFDEEGLKELNQEGVFSVLLLKLKEYTVIESKNAIEKVTENSQKKVEEIWDGQDKTDEDFDRRHSLSCDLPTKFNQRPLVPEDDSTAIFNEMTDFDFHWRNLNYQAPNTPQWSPLGPSPAPDELLAGDDDTTPPDSPAPVLADEQEQGVANDPVENLLGEPLDQDESSSSRDGFDQMHSPALLPLANPFTFGETPNTAKRDRQGSASSNSSNEGATQQDEGNAEFSFKMAKDLRQVPKRAKMDDVKENDRVRSRSLDTGSKMGVTSAPINIPAAGPSSPSPEVTLPDMGNAACSPSFLRFVNDTCSVSPMVLKQAGRDATSSSEDVSTTTSSWKLTRRRVSGASKKLDELSSTITNETNEPSASTENSVTKLTKAVSNPLPMATEKPTSADNNTSECSNVGSDPVTPVQIILRLLCHYCEMSNDYVNSLALENDIASCFFDYVMKIPGPLDRKFYRIIDRLSSCPESFNNFITSFLLTSVAASASLRMLSSRNFDEKRLQVLCESCKVETTAECNTFLDNIWHNIAISSSSLFCRTSVTMMIAKGKNLARAGTCATLLLCLWCLSSENRMANLSESMQRSILSNLAFIQVDERLKLLCDVIFTSEPTTVIYQSCAYTIHMLAGYGHKLMKSENGEFCSKKIEESPDLFEDVVESEQTKEDDGILNLFSKSTSDANDAEGAHKLQSACKYDQHCDRTQPDKILVFLQELKSADEKVKDSQCLTRSQKKCKRMKMGTEKVDNSIPVHTDILSTCSPMFEAMLSGKYRESSETTIRIQDISYSVALYIIHSIYGCEEEDCCTMKDIWTEVSKSPMTKYEIFCKYQAQAEQCHAEIDILKVMDRWLLDTIRREYYGRHLEYFTKWYIRKELMYPMIELLEKNDLCLTKRDMVKIFGDSKKAVKNVVSCLPVSDSCLFRELFFLKFALNHSFQDIVQNIVMNLLSPCYFRHNHEVQGRVLSYINSKFTESVFSDMFQNNVDEILKRLITTFEKR